MAGAIKEDVKLAKMLHQIKNQATFSLGDNNLLKTVHSQNFSDSISHNRI